MSELLFVGQVLPFATAAHAEVLAHGLAAKRRWFDHADDMRFGVAVFFLVDFDVDNVAGSAVGDENDQVVDASNALAFGGNAFYLYALDYGQFFTFA